MDYDQYIAEGIKAVKKLFDKSDFTNAKLGCDQLLKTDPYNKTLQKLREKIEREILRANEEKVKKEIERTWFLWNEKRYGELLQFYNQLYEYAPQYERLSELMQKAEEALSGQDREKRKKFLDDAVAAIKKIFAEKKYGETIQACQELLIMDSRNSEAKQILQKTKEALVEEKLKDNERIVDSGDYETALQLYESLLTIDPKSEHVQKLMIDAQRHLDDKKKLVRRIHINEGIKRMKDLFAEREYEKVIQTAEEVLQLDSENFTARMYRSRAGDTIEAEIDAVVLKRLKESQPALAAEYQKQKTDFIRI